MISTNIKISGKMELIKSDNDCIENPINNIIENNRFKIIGKKGENVAFLYLYEIRWPY